MGRHLDLGCGERKVDPSYVGIDTLDYDGVDLVGDAFEILRAIPADTVAGVYSSHFLEHIEDVPAMLAEITRVIAPGGSLELVVPHFSNAYFYSDATHRTAFGLYTLSYFARDEIYSRRVPTYQRELDLVLESVDLGFKSPRPFYGRYALRRSFGALVNLTPWTQEFYEENLSGLVSCYEIRFRARKLSAPASPGTSAEAGEQLRRRR